MMASQRNKKTAKGKILPYVIITLVVLVIFLGIGLVAKLWFGDNAYPFDYEYMDSYDWADRFFSWYFISTFISMILNGIIVPIVGFMTDKYSRTTWFVYLIINVLACAAAAGIFLSYYGEDFVCKWIMCGLFVFQYPVTFIISASAAPRHWDFPSIIPTKKKIEK